MAAERKVQRRRSSWRLHLLGLLGLGCVAWSAAGLLGAWEEAPPTQYQTAQAPSEEAVPPAPIQHQIAENAQAQGLPYYPLEVGRYWVYEHADPHRGAPVKIERRIERREERAGQELFFFSDGTLVYLQEGKVFEVSPQGGGVNVIPLERSTVPYVYQSQGLRIEKRVGAADTTVVVAGRSYPGCLEVVTHLRSPERRAEMYYSSYYARGVGLVGQEPWPRQPRAVLTVALQDYGVQQL